MVIGSGMLKLLPSICTVAPLATVVVPEAVPKAAAFLISTAPVVIFAVPEKVLVPCKIKVSVPVLMIFPPPEITPEIRAPFADLKVIFLDELGVPAIPNLPALAL
ncbi:unannotated protein [freshwater metagenome]|uniref:Unannotated protein n=1 Tax=freshwater metagenome TaxID=449393 RepID=A0A6J6ZTV0_9ZZZZ